jgi:hypothetical protein
MPSQDPIGFKGSGSWGGLPQGEPDLELVIIIALYAFLGGAIKFIDQAYDEGSFSTWKANLLAIAAGVTMGFLMAWDGPFSTAFFAAMLISLVLARKVDNLAFLIGLLCAVGTFIAFDLTRPVSLMPLPILVFLIAGIVDEVMDGVAHKRHLAGLRQRLLAYRPASDIGLVAMMALGLFDWSYLLPYFAFTISYMTIELVSTSEWRVLALFRPSRPRA